MGSDVGLDLWLQFSKLCREKSEGNEEKHERMWQNFGTRMLTDGDSVGIGSLRYWAKHDSPEAYRGMFHTERALGDVATRETATPSDYKQMSLLNALKERFSDLGFSQESFRIIRLGRGLTPPTKANVTTYMAWHSRTTLPECTGKLMHHLMAIGAMWSLST